MKFFSIWSQNNMRVWKSACCVLRSLRCTADQSIEKSKTAFVKKTKKNQLATMDCFCKRRKHRLFSCDEVVNTCRAESSCSGFLACPSVLSPALCGLARWCYWRWTKGQHTLLSARNMCFWHGLCFQGDSTRSSFRRPREDRDSATNNGTSSSDITSCKFFGSLP